MRRLRRRRPVVLMILAGLGLAFFVLPLAGLLAQAPWGALPGVLASDIVTDAIRLSLVSSVAATALAIVLGVPLAWLLARVEMRAKSVVRGLVLLPLVLPPVVGGAALLFSFGRRGFIGQTLEASAGIVLPFSLWGVILANAFVALPFLVITVEGALRNLDPKFETAAATLGASNWTVLGRVTLPMLAPALVSGTVLAWARAFGEFGATVTFAGSLAGRTQTLPLAVFVALESDRDAAIAMSLIMVTVSLAVLAGLRDRWWGALS